MTVLGQIEIRKLIAERLKKARVSAGYKTAGDFCRDFAVDPKLYVRHEEGKSAIKASQAVLYSQRLRVSLFWLMLGEE
jgi:hypothetical protein